MATLRNSVFAILATLIALGAVEGIAYWWMHPVPAGLGQPVLAYRPSTKSAGVPAADQQSGVGDQESGVSGHETAPALSQKPSQSSSPNQKSGVNNHQSEIPPSSSPIANFQSPISDHSSYTPLPELVSHAMPSLRCSTGTAARIDRDDGITVHVAFFEWDLASSINVLEAFKHLPEQCMGSIGLKLVEIRPIRAYKIGDETLSFDHTVFLDPVGRPVHAFKGVWVSGAANLLGDSLRGGIEQWRQIRIQAALKRFRPAHARVAQGAILGIANPDRAWEIFEESILRDLVFQQ